MNELIEILWGKIIVNFFGYNTLLILFRIARYEKGLEWLAENSLDESKEFAKGCLINIVGMVSSFLSLCAIAYLYYLFKNH